MDLHSFHIPVMGLGYTIDSPVKVAHLGIASVIALANDSIIEKIRAFYCRKYNVPYRHIPSKKMDYRAERIREYLNLVDEIVKERFSALCNSVMATRTEIDKFIALLPERSEVKESFRRLTFRDYDPVRVFRWVTDNLRPGSIDVNIMTKLDKENFHRGEKLPQEYNDAHAALRGFATSNLRSSVIFSAGMNPALYNYLQNFPDFFPDHAGELRKKIILKVSDYRSALIQGKMLAKKGLWVSEFRVESGLNCGGHAFATDGYLLGPVLEEFKANRFLLRDTLFEIYVSALLEKKHPVPASPPEIRISAQGGVGTAGEHRLMLEHYGLDSVGWGTPFMLVPEATTVDDETVKLLAAAKEEDVYLSHVSPLGVPFNNLRYNTKDIEKMERAASGKPGSPCTLQHLKLFRDEDNNAVCTASREYQKKKLAEAFETIKEESLLKEEAGRIVDKVCLCTGLAASAGLVYGIDTGAGSQAVSVCPGPNIAWFSKVVSLSEMTGHIYGRKSVIARKGRPHMFIQELKMYVEYLKNIIRENTGPASARTEARIKTFRENLLSGIEYYHNLIRRLGDNSLFAAEPSIRQLNLFRTELKEIRPE